ncbi:hypothetical protein [Sulfuriroseicoccus oceanibius]|uniref:Phosphoesterase n=1 Tax=Sulfuriroseicoccus oceanibius TaxID=2707525 RepID=A0A6B3L9K5_9BACT|nr:hypothetical protein [Sulfuriroseicoccus oceanibius]QQL44169.1 hypothetical protein G3M56_009705 [Sulfuriroseicoccus oceanibius]
MSKSSRYGGEKVLVVKRALFDELGAFNGFEPDSGRYFHTLLSAENNFFLDRDDAEEDPSHKQLIPYCIFTHKGKILHYTRGGSGGEARLHAKGSIGVGGHVNLSDVDAEDGHLGEATYNAGVDREIREELAFDGDFTHKVIGLINDDTNDVGKVHLGIVHLVEFTADSPNVKANEDSIANLAFHDPADLAGDDFPLETWSQLCIEARDQWLAN